MQPKEIRTSLNVRSHFDFTKFRSTKIKQQYYTLQQPQTNNNYAQINTHINVNIPSQQNFNQRIIKPI